jgi:hypothetical protein
LIGYDQRKHAVGARSVLKESKRIAVRPLDRDGGYGIFFAALRIAANDLIT